MAALWRPWNKNGNFENNVLVIIYSGNYKIICSEDIIRDIVVEYILSEDNEIKQQQFVY